MRHFPSDEEAAKLAKFDRILIEQAAINSAGLPPHDPDATCPKCGADANRVAVVFHRLSQQSTFMGWMPYKACPSGWEILGEHLCRICGRCDYAWQERPVTS